VRQRVFKWWRQGVRRFRIGLRTLFTLTTIAAVLSWWVVAQLRWIDQRREYVYSRSAQAAPSAPWPLWLFGELGANAVIVRIVNFEARELKERTWPDELGAATWDKFLTTEDRAQIARARRLFPEATLVRPTFFRSKTWDAAEQHFSAMGARP
jgi:hypothetical protein